MFDLVPALAAKEFIIELRLCVVLFEDNSYYPWVMLIPKVKNAKNMLRLTMEERAQLMREIALCEEAMSENFPCDQTNVAMIGNKTPQLHVHIICRREGDKDWPGTVWGGKSKPYSKAIKEEMIAKIKKAIMIKTRDEKFLQF